MNKFIKRVLAFIFIIVILVALDTFLQKTLLFRDENLKLPKNIHILILGHSHAACSYNTKFIKNAVNIATPGEAYIYTYFKAKKVIDNNPQIKKVFIEFTNNQIEKGMNNWIWDDIHLQYRIKSCGVLLDNEAIQLLYEKNSTGLINAFSKSLFDNLGCLFVNRKGMVLKGGMGKFTPCDVVYLKKKLPARRKSRKINNSNAFEISDYNILYLEKIVKYCKGKNIQVCLVRSPMSKNYDVSFTEHKFKEILLTKFENVEWLDNKDFPIPDKGFQDKEHLNSYGAKFYSQCFNQQIN